MKSEKQNVREKFKKIRDSLPESHLKSASDKITRKILHLPQLIKAKTVGLYLSKGSEVQTIRLLENLLSLGKNTVLPKVVKKSRTTKKPGIDFFLVCGLKDCELGSYHILEPKKRCRFIAPSKIDLLFVPGIVFDRKGFRLGYGKGFYDRFLKNFPNLTLGLAYDKTVISSLPNDHDDQRVDGIITEKKTIWFKERKTKN